MKKHIFNLAFLLVMIGMASAQSGGTTQDIGKALYNSLKSNNEAILGKYYPTLAELKIIRDAKSTKEDTTILKFLAQSTSIKLNTEWAATKNKLETDGVIWDKADMPAVSHEPYMGEGKREHTVVQVMFSCNGKKYTTSVRCVNVNGQWYVAESIQPAAQEVK